MFPCYHFIWIVPSFCPGYLQEIHQNNPDWFCKWILVMEDLEDSFSAVWGEVRRIYIHLFFWDSIQNESHLLPYFRGMEEKNEMFPKADVYQNLHCRTRAHFVWWKALEWVTAEQKQKGRTPKPPRIKPGWPLAAGCIRHGENTTGTSSAAPHLSITAVSTAIC